MALGRNLTHPSRYRSHSTVSGLAPTITMCFLGSAHRPGSCRVLLRPLTPTAVGHPPVYKCLPLSPLQAKLFIRLPIFIVPPTLTGLWTRVPSSHPHNDDDPTPERDSGEGDVPGFVP